MSDRWPSGINQEKHKVKNDTIFVSNWPVRNLIYRKYYCITTSSINFRNNWATKWKFPFSFYFSLLYPQQSKGDIKIYKLNWTRNSPPKQNWLWQLCKHVRDIKTSMTVKIKKRNRYGLRKIIRPIPIPRRNKHLLA